MGISKRTNASKLERASFADRDNCEPFRVSYCFDIQQATSCFTWLSGAAICDFQTRCIYEYGLGSYANSSWVYWPTTNCRCRCLQSCSYKRCILWPLPEIHEHGHRARRVARIYFACHRRCPATYDSHTPKRRSFTKPKTVEGKPYLQPSEVDVLSL